MAKASFTATVVGVVANPLNAGAGATYGHFYLKVKSTAPDCVVALETSPDNTTYTEVARVTGSKWGYSRSDLRAQYAHVNVISLGTNAPPLAAVIAANP